MKLNLGCGIDFKKGYLNIDARQCMQDGAFDIEPDIVADFTKLNFPAGSISEILLLESLEHIPQADVIPFLTKCYEWLSVSSKIVIKVPDMKSLAEEIFNGRAVEDAIDRIYGGQDHTYNFHKSGFDFFSLEQHLISAGFRKNLIVKKPEAKPTWNMTVEAIK